MSVRRNPRLIPGLLLVSAGWIALLADAVPARADIGTSADRLPSPVASR
jgi:hypothetical protein